MNIATIFIIIVCLILLAAGGRMVMVADGDLEDIKEGLALCGLAVLIAIGYAVMLLIWA